MGRNFEPKFKGKVGDIIYPAYNYTNGFWQTPRWDLVLAVDKEGIIIRRRFIWEHATVDAIKCMQELELIRGKK